MGHYRVIRVIYSGLVFRVWPLGPDRQASRVGSTRHTHWKIRLTDPTCFTQSTIGSMAWVIFVSATEIWGAETSRSRWNG